MAIWKIYMVAKFWSFSGGNVGKNLFFGYFARAAHQNVVIFGIETTIMVYY